MFGCQTQVLLTRIREGSKIGFYDACVCYWSVACVSCSSAETWWIQRAR